MKTTTTVKLTQEGAMTILRGALDKARQALVFQRALPWWMMAGT